MRPSRWIPAGLIAAAWMFVQPATAAEPPPHLRSEVPGLAIRALRQLPRGPLSETDDPACGPRRSDTHSPIARQIVELGWAVTAEEQLGPYEAVSFAGRFESGTSGSCQISQGNVALFRDGKLVAVIYARHEPDASIGSIRPLDNGNLRVWDGDLLSQPVADLHVSESQDIAVDKMAAIDTACQGKAEVPAVFGMPIDQARKALFAHGWRPANSRTAPKELDATIGKALFARGIREVRDCSGTGFGFCTFKYTNAAGILQVVTAGDGESPNVAHYGVDCR